MSRKPKPVPLCVCNDEQCPGGVPDCFEARKQAAALKRSADRVVRAAVKWWQAKVEAEPDVVRGLARAVEAYQSAQRKGRKP